ncbi:MAG: hypothetical protein IIC64_05485 [SAR324 cluster bacterium]|nr:hypothetical protein [SAR324 cluster bacterium]
MALGVFAALEKSREGIPLLAAKINTGVFNPRIHAVMDRSNYFSSGSHLDIA